MIFKRSLGACGKRRDRRREDCASESLAREPQGSRIPFSYSCGRSPARPERPSEKRLSLGELRPSGPTIACQRTDHIGQRRLVRRTLDRHPHVGAEGNRDRRASGRTLLLRRRGSHRHTFARKAVRSGRILDSIGSSCLRMLWHRCHNLATDVSAFFSTDPVILSGGRDASRAGLIIPSPDFLSRKGRPARKR